MSARWLLALVLLAAAVDALLRWGERRATRWAEVTHEGEDE